MSRATLVGAAEPVRLAALPASKQAQLCIFCFPASPCRRWTRGSGGDSGRRRVGGKDGVIGGGVAVVGVAITVVGSAVVAVGTAVAGVAVTVRVAVAAAGAVVVAVGVAGASPQLTCCILPSGRTRRAQSCSPVLP